MLNIIRIFVKHFFKSILWDLKNTNLNLTNKFMQNNLAKPLGDRVLVKPEQVGDKTTKSGIIITDSASRGETVFGEVVAIGPGIFTHNGERIPISVEVGDKVMYKKDMGILNNTTTLHHRSYIRIYCYFKAKNQISNLGLTPFATAL